MHHGGDGDVVAKELPFEQDVTECGRVVRVGAVELDQAAELVVEHDAEVATAVLRHEHLKVNELLDGCRGEVVRDARPHVAYPAPDARPRPRGERLDYSDRAGRAGGSHAASCAMASTI